MTSLPTTRTSYVSRVADFGRRPGVAVDLPKGVEGAGGVRLLIRHAYPPRSPGSFWSEYLVYPAVLDVPGRHPRQLPVEVELAPWSTGRTEVGLRFARPLRPEGRQREFDAASRAVEALVRQLEEPGAIRSDDLVGPGERAAVVSTT
jgi:hypothetical protein